MIAHDALDLVDVAATRFGHSQLLLSSISGVPCGGRRRPHLCRAPWKQVVAALRKQSATTKIIFFVVISKQTGNLLGLTLGELLVISHGHLRVVPRLSAIRPLSILRDEACVREEGLLESVTGGRYLDSAASEQRRATPLSTRRTGYLNVAQQACGRYTGLSLIHHGEPLLV